MSDAEGPDGVHEYDDAEDPGANEPEIDRFFDEEELQDYERIDETWLYE